MASNVDNTNIAQLPSPAGVMGGITRTPTCLYWDTGNKCIDTMGVIPLRGAAGPLATTGEDHLVPYSQTVANSCSFCWEPCEGREEERGNYCWKVVGWGMVGTFLGENCSAVASRDWQHASDRLSWIAKPYPILYGFNHKHKCTRYKTEGQGGLRHGIWENIFQISASSKVICKCN